MSNVEHAIPGDYEAHRYTKGDTPLHTGVLTPAAEWVESLARA